MPTTATNDAFCTTVGALRIVFWALNIIAGTVIIADPFQGITINIMQPLGVWFFRTQGVCATRNKIFSMQA